MIPGNGLAAHVREQRSVLAAGEKRVLVWMAARLPPWVTSDQLTGLALVSMAAAGASFAAMRLTPWAAVGVVAAMAANWFGDSLDGTLARVRNRQRPRYGFYVDHVVDVAGTALLLAGMACSGAMYPIVAIAALAAYLMVSAESYLATHAVGVFRMSFFKIGPTELRILLAAAALEVTRDPRIDVPGTAGVRLLDVGGAVAIAALIGVFAFNAVRHARVLARAEPLPASPAREAA
jgi:phosphatidylglycerophosphate synthase